MSIIPGIEKAAPERTETSKRVMRIAKLLADLFFDLLQAFLDLFPHSFRKAFIVFEESIAGFGGDNQTRRHRQTSARHLAKAGAFAAQERLVLAVALFEEVDPFVGGLLGNVGRFLRSQCSYWRVPNMEFFA